MRETQCFVGDNRHDLYNSQFNLTDNKSSPGLGYEHFSFANGTLNERLHRCLTVALAPLW